MRPGLPQEGVEIRRRRRRHPGDEPFARFPSRTRRLAGTSGHGRTGVRETLQDNRAVINCRHLQCAQQRSQIRGFGVLPHFLQEFVFAPDTARDQNYVEFPLPLTQPAADALLEAVAFAIGRHGLAIAAAARAEMRWQSFDDAAQYLLAVRAAVAE